ncbi:putative nucleotidyltransferase substrate binding domain-containing protein [Pseudomonas saudiphocaensis]|uniref:putative nucleotidyltransferase substrate binding domain-containing protein n=1 Tax=Pseudomonas saudiphocaensis TaxID=1499686 RepID=UPI000F78835D|nr:putative nucleotidyltransferase substrate binding domain-containing protein [Pseudomonas saudiphocaensis]RRV17484.1 CBS domain-containing protein [Pseudomonas saudiphocaensis]
MSKGDTYAEAGKTAVLQNIHGTMEFLRKYAPFKQMEAAHLAFLVENCELRFYAEGDSIISPEDGTVQHFYIVKQGRVHGQRPHTSKRGTDTTFEVIVGECFPMAALMGERATRTGHFAAEDTFCLLLNKPAFVKLISKSEVFRDFAMRGVSSLLDLVNQQAQTRAVENLGERYSLETTVGELAVHHPVSCLPSMPLDDAVGLMQQANVGSIVIVDEEQHPLGIFTLRDLRRVIGNKLGDLSSPISEFMTHGPFYLPPSATAFDAAIAMTERQIGHVCVVQDGLLCGVISERDLFSLQRVDLVHLAQTILHADRVESLVAVRTHINKLVDNMLAHGASSTQITHIITLLNDHTVRRVIELAIADMGDPGVPFTWLCFGSEGRREQTLHTDQDNGILFEAEDTAEAARIRGKLLPLAERITRDLDTCGFTLCKGNIMASNPELCLSRKEWMRRFSSFVRDATAENLLFSTIFFDLRSIWGPEEGCNKLQRHMLDEIAESPVFQRLMANNALRHRPPVGRFRDFVLERKGDDKDTLDLKIQGLTPFVDGARLLALANGIGECNTLERLRLLVEKGAMDPKDGEAYEEAYHFIQQTRMELHQQQSRDNQPFSNRLAPQDLNNLDRRILRESFRQAQRLQGSLALRYQL